MSKLVTVTLYRPDGGTSREFNDVEVLSYSKDSIEFRKRTEDEETATVYDYTSNLKYLIAERTTGPKSLI